MSDTADSDEIEAIREQKKEALTATPSEPIHIDDADHFKEVLGDHRVVLVDFYADWCGPCKMLAPVVETIAAETDAAVAKVDVDDHQDLAAEYQVQGVPTLYLFVDGEAQERMVGVQDEGTLTDLVEQHT